MLRETQTLRAGCSKARPKIFAPSQTPSAGARDGQNLISWRRSLPSPTNPGLMHAILSYHGNRPTHPPTHTHKQTGPITIHCTAASVQCNKNHTPAALQLLLSSRSFCLMSNFLQSSSLSQHPKIIPGKKPLGTTDFYGKDTLVNDQPTLSQHWWYFTSLQLLQLWLLQIEHFQRLLQVRLDPQRSLKQILRTSTSRRLATVSLEGYNKLRASEKIINLLQSWYFRRASFSWFQTSNRKFLFDTTYPTP